MGLNNIYRRLSSYYGEVDIIFSSVPFFENRVCLVLPAKYFANEEKQDAAGARNEGNDGKNGGNDDQKRI